MTQTLKKAGRNLVRRLHLSKCPGNLDSSMLSCILLALFMEQIGHK
jgi:hypothetical protein